MKRIKNDWRSKLSTSTLSKLMYISIEGPGIDDYNSKSRTQVAFQVLLYASVKVRTERVLILKQEVVNMGQCYNTVTGYFTAPVSGVYLFIATATTADFGKEIELLFVHEGNEIAYLAASKDEGCTCHVAIKVAQGDRVWLRTFKPDDDGYMHFCGGLRTSFSGVLVHPDF